MNSERKRTESDDLAEMESATERDNLQQWGSRTAPERGISAKMLPDGTVERRAWGPVYEDDFTGPLKDIYIAQYGSWDEYRSTNHTAKWLKENGYL